MDLPLADTMTERYRGMDETMARALLAAFGDPADLIRSLTLTAEAFALDPADLDHAVRTVTQAAVAGGHSAAAP